MRLMRVFAITAGLLASAQVSRAGVDVDFNLLTWGNGQATAALPSATGLKPADGSPGSDWLIYTPGDTAPGAPFNPQGSLSHNLAQPPGSSASDFTLAPSLSGTLGLSFASTGPGAWSVTPIAQAYTGVATPIVALNQFLVAPGDPAAQNAGFNVDGVVTPGVWQSTDTSNYAINYNLDFYLATNADGDPSPADIDATFDNVTQSGYLIPVDQLTAAGLSGVALTSPLGFFTGDFEQYLLDEIAPRLPVEATYLLVTQAAPTQPGFAGVGLPITTNSTVGNTTIAYTTQAIPEPGVPALMAAGLLTLIGRRRNA